MILFLDIWYVMNRIFFKALLALALILSANIQSYASMAYPGLVDFRQPNGNVVKVYMRGSETLKWAETEDGYTLLYDEVGNLVYAEEDAQGNLIPSKVIASDRIQRSSEVVMRLQSIPKKLRFSESQIKMAEQVHQVRMKQMLQYDMAKSPVIGTKNMLLILVEFKDCKFQKTKEDFDKLMNQLNYTENGRYGSVRDFYKENSFDQLNLVTDVVGVYCLQNNREYYGGNDASSNDRNPRQMAQEAVTMANIDVDFSKYDNDKDGILDGVHIIYAGPGEEAGGGGDCIWAHSWTVSATLDGVRTNRYSCSPEIRGSGGSNITHIGVICHEIGHVLGTMDFYDTNYGTGGQYPGTGKWDLMASGSWNGDGACPAHFNPYTKIYDYGWAEAADGNKADSFTLRAKSKNGFLRINTQSESEFFLLEYRAVSGFDSRIPYHGLMIYRASEGLSRMGANTINAYHKQQFYPIVANATSELPTSSASSYGNVDSPSAPFPGTSKVGELTDFTIPSMKSWIGIETGFPITSIIEYSSEEYVTFDIAGGREGGAYGFKVTDSDTSSITLQWNTPSKETVMIAYSKEPTFGTPQSRTYSVGESIDGGGEVIYVGNSTSFKHTQLEDMTDYYYKIFTLKDDGSYISGKQLKAKTTVDIIRKFPYEEDFSSMAIPSSWRHEFIFNNVPWKVDMLFETGEYSLMYEASFDARRSTRAILPVIDFSSQNSAILSFDYRNFLQDFDVCYRVSPKDEWHTLCTLKSQDTGLGSDIINKVTNAEKHIDIILPNLSSTYEVAFFIDYVGASSVISSAEIITIDNIKVSSDFDVFVSTQYPSVVTSTMSKIPVIALGDRSVVDTKGVFWSIDQKSWTCVESGVDDEVILTSLPTNRTIYYKGFAKTGSGEIYYGDIFTFNTMAFSKGSGTNEDPYLIGSMSEWESLRNTLNEGNDCTNLYFALSNSFSITYSLHSTQTFNGHLDGRGNTITLTYSSVKSLFNFIGLEGKISNLKVNVNNATSAEGVYCFTNQGVISDCSIFIQKSSAENLGGFCRDNEGLIYNCHAEIYSDNPKCWGGGICAWNKGSIIGCSFKGKLSGNNNATIGGIAGLNYTIDKDAKVVCGLISDCVNYGTIEIYLNEESKSWWIKIGGITGSNSGWVQRCVNKGTIIAANGDNSCISGGIVGSNENLIVDCYNLGDIITSNNFSEDSHVAVGGIAGYGYLSSIQNSFSLKNIMVNGEKTQYINGVIGKNNQTEIENCYYWGEDTDSFATRCEYSELCSMAIIDKLNNKDSDVWTLFNGVPALKWEKSGIIMSQEHILDIDATRAGISLVVLDENIVEAGLEWRKKGDYIWAREKGNINYNTSINLEGLNPATIYETRIYAIDSNNQVHNSEISYFATLFASNGTTSDPHLISSYSQLLAFNEMVAHGFSMGMEKVCLTEDIDMKGDKGHLWRPIKSMYERNASFEGEFDGAGYVLSNMYIETSKCFAGFFGTFCGYIHDLTIMDSQIKCNTPKTDNGYYAGVGGIVGSCNSSSIYIQIVERCGFEGTIDGGNRIGGIIGSMSSSNNAIKDCYANVDINYSQIITSYSSKTGVGGIVGEGKAKNSYATGNITVKNIFGLSLGPITGLYYNGSNADNYYDITCNKSFTNKAEDTFKTYDYMTSDDFLKNLSSGVWIRADHLNGGYPVFASRQNSRVSTCDAEQNKDGNVLISGLYMQGVDKKFEEYGFQWYSKKGDNANVLENIVDNTNYIFNYSIPVEQITEEGLNYRAFVRQGDDYIYGEWKSFMPTYHPPVMTISSVDVIDSTTSEFSYLIEEGSDTFTYRFEYSKDAGFTNAKSLNIDITLLKLKIFGLEALQKYFGRIVAENDDIRYESNVVVWTQSKSVDDDYTPGDANNDGYVDVADLAAQVQFILGVAGSNLIKEAADMDGSGVVEVNDFVALVNVILTHNTITRYDNSNADRLVDITSMSADKNGNGEVWLSLSDGLQNINGLQFDMVLPTGVTPQLDDIIVKGGKHSVWCESIGNNRYRVICASMSNMKLHPQSTMCIKLQSTDNDLNLANIAFENIVLSDTNAIRYESQTLSGIFDVEKDNDKLIITVKNSQLILQALGDQYVRIVSLNGTVVEEFVLSNGKTIITNLRSGVYIINGHKIVI